MEKLLKRIVDRDYKIGIIGLGYVGLPLYVEFAKANFHMYGVDLDENKIEKLKNSNSYVIDVKDDELKEINKNGEMNVSTDYKIINNCDAIIIAVPTPLSKSKDPDMSYIISALDGIKPYLKENIAVVLESTTYPGTTRELLAVELENQGFEIGKTAFVAFSPERVDPGNKKYSTKNTPKVLGGMTENCNTLFKTLYEAAVEKIIMVDSPEEAEMAKLLENTFRAVNIGLVNEMTIMCDRMGINMWNVIKAAASKPFGFMPFYPGPGIGGHCIPLDPSYLSWKAKMFGYYNRFIELATDINGNMPRFVVSKVFRIFNKINKCVSCSKILLLGMAYKADIDDLRESPALEIYDHLLEDGAKVDYYDPYVDCFNYKNDKVYSIKEINETVLKEYDLVILTTNHKCFDKNFIIKNSNLIFDTRDFFEKHEKVIKL
jgi:UDP-N-acetyl-D-glucosamine dehydrogenase